MRFVLNPYIAIPIAVLALAAAGFLWYVMVRPVPEQVAVATVTERGFAEAERVEKSVPQTGRVVETGPRKTAYTLPYRHVYTLRLDGRDGPVQHSVQSIGEPEFEIGQRVRVVYQERHIPFLGSRVYVSTINPLDEQGHAKE